MKNKTEFKNYCILIENENDYNKTRHLLSNAKMEFKDIPYKTPCYLEFIPAVGYPFMGSFGFISEAKCTWRNIDLKIIKVK